MTNSTAPIVNLNTRFFGLDVHQNTIVISQAEAFGKPQFVQTITNESTAVEDFFKRVVADGPQVHATYEAGGCGYGLARQLKAMGIATIIAAPSKITKTSGEIKNDKRDAHKLARLLRNHILTDHKELHPVYVPEIDDEAIREKTRQRNAFKRQVRVAMNQVMSMLRRHGMRYTSTKTTWNKTYRAWLERVDFGNATLQDVFREYLDQLADLEARVAKCDKELDNLCQEWNKGEVVKAVRALKGFQNLSAASLVAEIGSFARFESASGLMAYLGLTPSEYSSGERVTRGRISKAGNKRARTLLIEAASCAYRKPKSKAAFLATCPTGLPQEVYDHAYKAQVRLHKKYWRLVNKGKNTNTAKTAVARELAGFVWWIGLMMETRLDAQPKAA